MVKDDLQRMHKERTMAKASDRHIYIIERLGRTGTPLNHPEYFNNIAGLISDTAPANAETSIYYAITLDGAYWCYEDAVRDAAELQAEHHRPVRVRTIKIDLLEYSEPKQTQLQAS